MSTTPNLEEQFGGASGASYELTMMMADLAVDYDFTGQRVLEIGAGYGGFVPALLTNHVDVVAVDPRYGEFKAYKNEVLAAIKDRKHLLAAEGIPKHDTWQLWLEEDQAVFRAFQKSFYKNKEIYLPGVAEALPFDDDSFDFVMSNNALTVYATDLEQAIRESARVARPGGVIALSPWTTDGDLVLFLDQNPQYAPAQKDRGFTVNELREPELTAVLPGAERIVQRHDIGVKLLEEGVVERIEERIATSQVSAVHLHLAK